MSDLADLKPRILRIAREAAGIDPPRYGYTTPAERLDDFLEVYFRSVGPGQDADVDKIAAAYFATCADLESRRLREAFADAVESAT